MEVAKIDWEDSNFEKDEIYEHINAPQWLDFDSPNDDDDNDDVAWFCRPDCNHPNSVEDFLKQSTPQSKVLRSASVSEVLPLGDRNRREAALKKRGIPQPTIWAGKDFNGSSRYTENGENENPNMSTPPIHKSKLIKETIKSSAEKKLVDIPLHKEENSPKLKSTLSTRNLFAGKDILNQITEFCAELKKLATRAKQKENEEKENTRKNPVKKQADDDNTVVLRERDNERKPLLETRKEKCEETEKSGNAKEKLRRKKRNDEAENTPPVSINLKNIRHKGEERLLQIRTIPPSPQCFSANCAPINSTPPKAFRPRPHPEKSVFQEVEESDKQMKKDESVGGSGNNGKSASLVAEREGRTLDVFWFLKPCTLSN